PPFPTRRSSDLRNALLFCLLNQLIDLYKALDILIEDLLEHYIYRSFGYLQDVINLCIIFALANWLGRNNHNFIRIVGQHFRDWRYIANAAIHQHLAVKFYRIKLYRNGRGGQDAQNIILVDAMVVLPDNGVNKVARF